MPYFRRDPQYQYVTNFNWSRGEHSIRFGFDFYNQHLNQVQPEIAGVAYHGGSGGFTFDGGPDGTAWGPSANVYNTFGSYLLGLPIRSGKILVVPDEYALRARLISFYTRDRWTWRMPMVCWMRAALVWRSGNFVGPHGDNCESRGSLAHFTGNDTLSYARLEWEELLYCPGVSARRPALASYNWKSLLKKDGPAMGGTQSNMAPWLFSFSCKAATEMSCTAFSDFSARLAATPAAWPRIMYCGSMRSEE